MASRGKLVLRLAVATVMSISLLGLAGVIPPPIPFEQRNNEYFPETGHSVEGDFYKYFVEHGGVAIFGYPITEWHEDTTTGMLIQYFQRARLQCMSRLVCNVTVAKLGVEMGFGQPSLPPDPRPADTPFQRFFPATGHTTAYAFLEYFDQKGGEPIFGYPITEPHYLNGRLVQYFERARMEWWPERTTGERVALTNLGDIYAQRYVSAEWLKPVGQARIGGATATPAVTSLRVTASIKDPVTRQVGNQTVTVLVADQTGNPVKGAEVKVTVYSMNGNHSYAGLITSDEGVAMQTWLLDPDRPGKPVIVDVVVTYGGVTASAQTSYMPWWGP